MTLNLIHKTSQALTLTKSLVPKKNQLQKYQIAHH